VTWRLRRQWRDPVMNTQVGLAVGAARRHSRCGSFPGLDRWGAGSLRAVLARLARKPARRAEKRAAALRALLPGESRFLRSLGPAAVMARSTAAQAAFLRRVHRCRCLWPRDPHCSAVVDLVRQPGPVRRSGWWLKAAKPTRTTGALVGEGGTGDGLRARHSASSRTTASASRRPSSLPAR